MATILKQDKGLKIGNDFVDAVTNNKLLSHGEIAVTHSNKRILWESTLPITDSEKILRQAAKEEGRRVIFFSSQAI